MKVDVKKVNEIKRELRFEVPKDRVTSKLDDVYKDIAKNAKIKGFRPGKAPRHILEKHHGRLAEEEMIKSLVPEVYQEGIINEKLNPIDYPEIHDVDFNKGILKFTAKLDIKPEIPIKDYKGLKVKRASTEVTDEDINKTLEYFTKAQGQGKEEDKKVEINDEFAKGMGYPSLDEFKKVLSRQIEMDKDRQNRIDIENQVVDQLTKKTKFPVPESLVNKQLEHRISQQVEHFKKHGMSDEEIAKKVDEARSNLKEQVEKDVKAYLIIDKIAQIEGIEAQKEGETLPAKVMEFLLKEAQWEEKK